MNKKDKKKIFDQITQIKNGAEQLNTLDAEILEKLDEITYLINNRSKINFLTGECPNEYEHSKFVLSRNRGDYVYLKNIETQNVLFFYDRKNNMAYAVPTGFDLSHGYEIVQDLKDLPKFIDYISVPDEKDHRTNISIKYE